MGALLDLPVHHLDRIHWRPDWVRMPDGEWRATVAKLAGRGRWIIDGNYGSTMDIRLRACDMVVLLNFPRRVCIYRSLKRVFLYRGKSRPDVAERCGERINLPFLHWIWSYWKNSRPKIMKQLKFGAESRQSTVGKRRRRRTPGFPLAVS